RPAGPRRDAPDPHRHRSGRRLRVGWRHQFSRSEPQRPLRNLAGRRGPRAPHHRFGVVGGGGARRASSAGVETMIGLLMFAMPAAAMTAPDPSDPIRELSSMSLEQLANVEVTSVSKAAQSLSSAPASIYVVTREEILRSGALSI